MNSGTSWLRRLAAFGLAFTVAIGLAGSVSGAIAPPATVDWDALTEETAVPNQLLVRFIPERAPRNALGVRMIQAHQELGATVEHEYQRIPWQVVSVPAQVGLANAAARYARDPAVSMVEPNYIVRPRAIPNDPFYPNLWGMQRINAPAAWDITTGSHEVIVAVIDSGVRYTHEDLAANMWENPNPTFGDLHGARWTDGTGAMTSGDPMDDDGHGTHVAGTIGAVGNNALGVVGVNWTVRIMALKFMDSSGGGTTADAISAIFYAIDKGAHVTCNSWGGGGYSVALEQAIDAARLANQLFVAAAGNDGLNNDVVPDYPSGYALDNIISVAALAPGGVLAPYSNYGATTVHLAAPGSAILSCWAASDTAYRFSQGTSMAAPHVAGAVALMLSVAAPNAPYTDLRNVLLGSVQPNPSLAGRTTTGGELDLAAAILAIAEPVVRLDREAYRSDASARVELVWPRAPFSQLDTTVRLSVTNSAGVLLGDAIVLCRRAGAYDSSIGRFLSDPHPLAALAAEHDAVLVAEWTRPSDLEVYEDSAPIDDVPPVISNVQIVDRDDVSLTVEWETDELAIGAALAGQMLPPSSAWTEASQEVFSTTHRVRITGLDAFTRYFVGIWAEDLAGNRGYFPVDPLSVDPADYDTASTIGLETAVRFDWESSPQGWIATNVNAQVCWEYGTPTTFGPILATRCWGTILNGRYPSGANATLTSPPFTVRSSPVIRFQHWMEAQYSLEQPGVQATPVPYGDYGQIEVLSRGVWQNVTRHADIAEGANRITGSSGGWRTVRLDLPVEFANQTLALRFRFVSDEQQFLDGNPAGWYVDDVTVLDVPDSGLSFSGCEVVDEGPGLTGNGNGLAEPGETVAIRPRVFNYGDAPVSGLTGSLVVQVAGNPSADAVLLDGSPAALTYGPIPAFSDAPSNESVRLQLSPTLPNGTVVTLLQTLTDGSGLTVVSRYDLKIVAGATIGGLVVDAVTSNPVQGALLVAEREGTRLLAVSEADGSFEIRGALSNRTYTVTASQAGVYSPLSRVLTAPASGEVFALGTAQPWVVPSSLSLEADIGGQASAMFTVSNDATSSAPLRVEPQPVLYDAGADEWLFLPLDPFTLAPGETRQVEVTASARNLRIGRYLAVILLELDTPLQETIEIPVEFLVRQLPVLSYDGYLVQNDTDGDGYLEQWETGDLFIYIRNASAESTALNVQGVLTPLHPAVTLTGGNTLEWAHVFPRSRQLSDGGVGLQFAAPIPEGELLGFQLDLSFDDGAGVTVETFTFEIEHRSYHTVFGEVTYPDPEDDTIFLPVFGAIVIATDSRGNQYRSSPTDAMGIYSMGAVPAGNIWFQVIPPQGVPYVAPEGRNEWVGADNTQVDFLLGDYGPEAPRLMLHEVVVDDTEFGDRDGGIDPGERLVVHVSLYNDGDEFADGLAGTLALADMGAGVGPFMSIVNGVTNAVPGSIGVSIPPQQVLATTLSFVVDVNPGAVGGDRQYFTLAVTDSSFPVAREWRFDFVLVVNPLYSAAGVVSFANPADATPENWSQVRVFAEVNGQRFQQIPGLDGSFRFGSIPEGASLELSIQVPPGFIASPNHAIASVTSDLSGLDFMIDQSQFTVSPHRLDEIIGEGSSATNGLTLSNSSAAPIDVDLSIAYKRGPYDVVSLSRFDALATLLEDTYVPWNQLDNETHVAGELEIRFRDGTGWMERHQILEEHGLRALFHLTLLPACVAVPLDEGITEASQIAPLAAALEADERILYVQPSGWAYSSAIPNDPLFALQQNLLNERQTGGTKGSDINVEPVWDITTGSRDIVVAIIDSGIDPDHADLQANRWRNPLEAPGDSNQDGFPGVQGVDDDGDAESSRWFFNVLTGQLQGPEVVDPRFDPEMWADNYRLVRKLGEHVGSTNYVWQAGANGIPDFFEPYLKGLVPFDTLMQDPRFVDSSGNGVPDIFDDSTGDGIPDLFGDEDGDGIINETGIDFRDEDVMMADYNNNGRPLVVQKIVPMPWPPAGGGVYLNVLVEQWDLEAIPLAAQDDDENGYANDFDGWNFFHWDNDSSDADMLGNHGTHMAGIVGASGNNGIGVSGVNWEVSLMPLSLMLRWEGPPALTSNSRIVKAMEYAVKNGAQVSTHGWGSTSGSGIMFELMKIAERDYNHLFVVAAGNQGRDNDKHRIYPAYYSTVLNNVITVAATDHDGQLAPFSNWGRDSVQIAAPGVSVPSTISDHAAGLEEPGAIPGSYAYKSGTSMACAHVAGAAALLWSQAPDSSYESIKNALLQGARRDPNLEGWVKSGGHLDVGRAFQAKGRDWLSLSATQVSVAASETVQVFFNNDLNLPAGYYEAQITASTPIGIQVIPVTLTVQEQALAQFDSLRLVADSDGDGYAEPGEAVEFHVSLRNVGGATFVNLQGTLSAVTPGVTVGPATALWPEYVYDGDVAESLTAFGAMLPLGAPADVEFDLALTSDTSPPQIVRVVLPVEARHALSGRVVGTDGVGVPAAIVECWGAAGESAVTDANGDFILQGLVDGFYKLRAIPSNHTRSAMGTAILAGADGVVGDLVVASPVVTVSTNRIEIALQQGFATQASLGVTNTALDAYAFEVSVMPRRRVGLFSDSNTLADLVVPIRRMGFEVDSFTNNFAIVHVVDEATGRQWIEQQVRHTWDAETVYAYDFVIADLSGARGDGRVFSEAERAVFEGYLSRGGKVLFTGGNPTTLPDNEGMTLLCGVAMEDRAASAIAEATAVENWNGTFAEVTIGDRLHVEDWIYDLAPLDGISASTRIFAAGLASKLTRNVVNPDLGGVAYLWSGNPRGSDWDRKGLWLDILRDILLEELYEPAALQTRVPWLQISPDNAVLVNGSTELSLSLNSDRHLEPGTYEAVVALVGLDRGEEIMTVPVVLSIQPPVLRAYTTGSVTDWRGIPLRGDGGSDSSLLQVVYAGPDGQVDPPDLADGSPTGDDQLLAVFPSGEALGRFGSGSGILPNSGRFDQIFQYAFPFGTPDAKVYVRAWDGPSFDTSLVYGDSVIHHTATYTAQEQRDFGSWQASSIVNYLRDSNGNSLPDGWIIENRPDLDPRSPLVPLDSSAVSQGVLAVPSGAYASRPYQVVVSRPSAKFVFALDQANNRIAIIPTNTPAATGFYGSAGSGNGQFAQPEGMAADPRPGHYRLAVADTANHRVQLFTYDPDTGALSFERVLATGGMGSGTNQLNRPAAVTFDTVGRIVVADKLNNRIAIIRLDGVWQGSFQGSGSYILNKPQGVAVDPDPDGGVWVCDTGNNRVTLYTTGGIFKRSIGSKGSAPGQFESPQDVQIWRVGSRKRLAVADVSNNRIQIFDPSGTHQISVGTGGTLVGQLNLPRGVFPMRDQPVLCVADTHNSRVQWFRLTLDLDGDGMDDFWEDLNGLDSTDPSDAHDDPDGDGVSNLGEFLLGTDPNNWDTSGDGNSDGWALANGMNPLEPSGVTPPGIVSLTADLATAELGDPVVVTLVYSQDIADSSQVQLSLSGGVTDVLAMTRLNSTTYQATYVVQPGDVGVVDAAVSGATSDGSPSYTQDPVVYAQSALFEVTFSLVSEVTSLTADPGNAEAGDSVTLTATFSLPVLDGTPKVSLLGAATLAPVAMTKVNSTNYTYTYTVQGADAAGVVIAQVSDAVDAGSSQTVAPFANPAAFSIYFPPFAITAITASPQSVSWQSVAGGTYNLETNQSLLSPAWGVFTNLTVVNEPVETLTIDPSLPSPMYFRVKRVNP